MATFLERDMQMLGQLHFGGDDTRMSPGHVDAGGGAGRDGSRIAYIVVSATMNEATMAALKTDAIALWL